MRLYSRSNFTRTVLVSVAAVFVSLISVRAQTGLGMKALVISATGAEPSYTGITTFLQYLGLPYTVLIASDTALTAEFLEDGSGAKYQAVFLATDTLGYSDGNTWKSAFDTSEWETLRAYQVKYGIRQVTYYTYPSAQYGLGEATVSSTDTSLEVYLTKEGKEVFPYLNALARVPIRHAYTFLAKPTDENTTVLFQDAQGHAVVSVRTYSDGRENLAVTTDNWQYLLHSQLMSYGIISWATRGIHLGERTVYLMPHVDDVFIAQDDLFDPVLNQLVLGRRFRLSAEDMAGVETWQEGIRSLNNFKDFSLVMVYNGEGAQDRNDPLVQYFLDKQHEYQWVSHTYSHPNLNSMSYANVLQELQLNHETATSLAFGNYSQSSLVTGEVSGLGNPEAMTAISDFGIRYVVSNTSVSGQNNPSPNAGMYNALAPLVLQIPRRPTNILTNATTVEEEVGFYNLLYRSYWGRDLTYEEILDFESDLILGYMVRYDMDPLMFHQTNLRMYDGEKSLLGDLINSVVSKYEYHMDLPVLTPPMHELGERMAQRMAYDKADVQATYYPGLGVQLVADSAVVVPVTGFKAGVLAGADTYHAGTHRQYGGLITSWIEVGAGETLWIAADGAVSTGGPFPAASTAKTYVPDTVSVRRGIYDWGTVASLSAQDEDTYDIRATGRFGNFATDWSAATTSAGPTDGVTSLEVRYTGQYTRRNVTQEFYLYNFELGDWERFDSRVVFPGDEYQDPLTQMDDFGDDITVSALIEDRPGRYVSATGEMKARVRGAHTSRFYSWANHLEWIVR